MFIKTAPNFKIKTQTTSNIKHLNECELYIHLRKINTNKIIFQTACSSGSQVAVAYLGSSGCKAGTLPHTHTHSAWDNLDTPVISHAHLWNEETRVSLENPCRHRENMQAPYRQWPWSRIDFIFFSLQHYRKDVEENDVI